MAKLTQLHLEWLSNNEFLELYLRSLADRLVYSNNRLDIESTSKDMANPNTVEDTYKALKILINNIGSPITEDIITIVADTINTHSVYISNGYRKIGEGTRLGGVLLIENPPKIQSKMQELLNKYFNEWNNLDTFEREAKFVREFIRIHPFEDGNVAKVIKPLVKVLKGFDTSKF